MYDVRAELQPASLRSLMLAIKAFSPTLATATRRRLRAAGDEIVQDIRREVTAGPPPGPKSRGLRQGLADGTRVSILTSATKQGISIVTSPNKLQPGQGPMAKAYNKRSFRHPVFKTGVWVSQEGRPYFGSVIASKKEKMYLAVQEALAEAIKEMEL